MKRIIVMTLAIVCLLGLYGCNNNADSPAEHEAFSADYGRVIDPAKEEFAEVFNEEFLVSDIRVSAEKQPSAGPFKNFDDVCRRVFRFERYKQMNMIRHNFHLFDPDI